MEKLKEYTLFVAVMIPFIAIIVFLYIVMAIGQKTFKPIYFDYEE